MFLAFTGEAIKGLKAGKSYEEVREGLWKIYVEVWEIKKAIAVQESVAITRTKRRLKVQKPIQSTIHIESGPINTLFSIPWKRTPEKIKSVDAGRRVLRRRSGFKKFIDSEIMK